MLTLCSWCGVVIRRHKPGDPLGVSHGICKSCLESVESELMTDEAYNDLKQSVADYPDDRKLAAALKEANEYRAAIKPDGGA